MLYVNVGLMIEAGMVGHYRANACPYCNTKNHIFVHYKGWARIEACVHFRSIEVEKTERRSEVKFCYEEPKG